MKKRFLIPMLLVMILALGLSAAGAETGAGDKYMKVTMQFSTKQVEAGDTIHVEIGLTNLTGDETPVMLYDPGKKLIAEFGKPVLKDGEGISWAGDWTVTEKQVEEGRITFAVKYCAKNENGETVSHIKNFSKKIVSKAAESAGPSAEPTPEPTPEPTAAPTAAPEIRGDVFLYGVYRPNPGMGWVAVGALDSAGDLWIAEKADVPWPATTERIMEMLKERRGMKLMYNVLGSRCDGFIMDKEWLRDMKIMAETVPAQEGQPKKTGIDIREQAVYAMRPGENNKPESVLLGMGGSSLFENKDPGAQEMYRWMWRQLNLVEIFGNSAGVASAIEPKGFEAVSVKDFFGLKEGAEEAEITAEMTDCEEGLIPAEMTKEETEQIRKIARLGLITGKRNSMQVTGGTMRYHFRDAEGNDLGTIETYERTARDEDGEEKTTNLLAVANDGMYTIAVKPEPVDTLTEKEQRLLTFTLDGVDYTIGKSTPRDMINNGWNCFQEWDGTLSFSDAEGYSSILVWTGGGSIDEPISAISSQFAYELDISYYGFDGIADPDNEADMDTIWRNKYLDRLEAEGYDVARDDDEDDEPDPDEEDDGRNWNPMTEWLKQEMGGVAIDNGPEAEVKLSDGRTLYMHAAASPINLSLWGESENKD